MKFAVFLTSVFLITTSLTAGAQEVAWQQAQGNCASGLHLPPKGPFAVMVYCEDALGVYLAVIHAKPIGAPAVQSGKWSLENRYWFDPVWASDVTGFKWAADGLKLLVSTSEIYGSGGLFELDLFNRKYTQILPEGAPVSINKPGSGYNVEGKKLEP